MHVHVHGDRAPAIGAGAATTLAGRLRPWDGTDSSFFENMGQTAFALLAFFFDAIVLVRFFFLLWQSNNTSLRH